MQVIRTGNKFSSDVALLVAKKLFGKTQTPAVSALIVPGEKISGLMDPGTENILESVGEIKHNNQFFEQEGTKVKFQFLQLEKRPQRKGGTKMNERVSDDLYSIVFHTNFTCHGIQFTLWTHSLPIVVVVHDSQKLQAYATIIWENAGSTKFQIQRELPWNQVSSC